MMVKAISTMADTKAFPISKCDAQYSDWKFNRYSCTDDVAMVERIVSRSESLSMCNYFDRKFRFGLFIPTHLMAKYCLANLKSISFHFRKWNIHRDRMISHQFIYVVCIHMSLCVSVHNLAAIHLIRLACGLDLVFNGYSSLAAKFSICIGKKTSHHHNTTQRQNLEWTVSQEKQPLRHEGRQ